MTFVVTTPSFSGPAELLLQLVSSHEVDILDVPLGPLVDAFVAALRDEATDVEMDQLSEFLLIGAILLEMKSQRLLPGPEAGELDEEFVGWEERDVLLARLLELRTYSALADAFVSLFERASRAYPRLAGVDHGLRGQPTGPARRRDDDATGAGVPAGDRGEAGSRRSTQPLTVDAVTGR